MYAKEFITDIINKFDESKSTAQLIRVHYRIKDLIDVNDFAEINEIFIEIIRQQADPNIAKMALIITKSFKDDETIRENRKNVLAYLEQKTGQPEL